MLATGEGAGGRNRGWRGAKFRSSSSGEMLVFSPTVLLHPSILGTPTLGNRRPRTATLEESGKAVFTTRGRRWRQRNGGSQSGESIWSTAHALVLRFIPENLALFARLDMREVASCK